ncbi:MAG: AzlC family ABC transporter permease [Oscillospiraceae bacterium]|nr:AzlC family ABC transporter permease [Oscillospiraceae bacterium]
MNETKKTPSVFWEGVRDGIPIALGYFAVSFSLGIAGRSAGLTVAQGMIASVLCMASAGQYALFTLIGASASLWEVAVVSLITNARYFLMSCALSQRIDPGMKNYHRFIFGGVVTDEIFGISIARPGYLDPRYNYGAMAVAIPGWSVGTGLGILMGNLLPGRIVSALSVALYGMFLAIIIPPAKKDKVVAGCVALSFAASYAFDVIPRLATVSAGTRTILLTVAISALAALLFPAKEAAENA